MARLIARGKYLFDGERKFYARGVSYGTFAPNSRGEPFPEPERTDSDFALMRELGANVVRTYEPPPPWMMEQAAKHGLKVMLGIPWASHLAFLDSREMVREIRNTIARTVAGMRDFRDAIFAYTIGNEIRADIVRWHGPKAISRFLGELRDLGKQADPEGLFTYANYPSTAYLDLSALDLLAFNVYLHREEDFRRYLTHLMALSGELPLVLSETGMDTIREGEESQADLLGWQSRAAFELGLSGFVVFAFTDEWYRGGSEITDWAFGLVTRERIPKLALRVVAEVFNGALPPPLESPPRASVVIAAYNAEQTLGACLASVADLNYPDYEAIVVDDGSTDSTASLAEAAGVRLLRRDHRGLGAARNAGADGSRGEIVAFIDADARADRDWLYHLVETVARRKCPAGGPNFPPAADSPMAALIAAAPGAPREVPLGDDSLAQLCGCNMAIEKAALKKLGGFDSMFTRAGDDVDLSWRLRDAGTILACAPGAIVIHQRRSTVGAYLSQQRGYGAGEGLLMRKHPLHPAAADGVYGGGGSILASLFASGRIYHGAFGRGLFQSLYPARGVEPLLQILFSIEWFGGAAILILAGVFRSPLGLLGFAALAVSITCAAVAATAAPLDRAHSGPRARAALVALCILGPLVRSIERERVRWRLPERGEITSPEQALQMRGAIGLVAAESASIAVKPLLESLRAALVRRGLTVAPSDGFQPFDLQIMLPPAIRVSINALDDGTERMTLRWRLSLARGPVALSACVLAMLLLMARFSLAAIVLILTLTACAFLVFAATRATVIPGVLKACAGQACGPGVRVTSSDEGNA